MHGQRHLRSGVTLAAVAAAAGGGDALLLRGSCHCLGGAAPVTGAASGAGSSGDPHARITSDVCTTDREDHRICDVVLRLRAILHIMRLVRPSGAGKTGVHLIHGLRSSAVGGLALHGG